MACNRNPEKIYLNIDGMDCNNTIQLRGMRDLSELSKAQCYIAAVLTGYQQVDSSRDDHVTAQAARTKWTTVTR